MYVENPLSCEVLKEARDKFSNFHIDEDFLVAMFRCLKLRKIYPQSKICFLLLVAKIFKKDIELLDFQIQPYNFRDSK